jgi:hypothetical protein
MYTKAIIFISLLMFGALSRASDYDTTLSMCQAYSTKDIQNELPDEKVSYEVTLEHSRIYQTGAIGFKNLYQGAKTALTLEGFGSSPAVKDLIGSEGYFRAMKECFGGFDENRYAWDSFTLLIILSDAAGQSLAYVGSTVISIGVVSKGIRIVKYGFELLSKTPYLATHPAIIKQLSLAGNVVTSGYLLKTGYDMFNNIVHPDIQTKKNILEKQIPELDKDSDDLLKLIAEEIQKEQSKPKNLRDNARIEKLSKTYDQRKRDHIDNMLKLKNVANT